MQVATMMMMFLHFFIGLVFYGITASFAGEQEAMFMFALYCFLTLWKCTSELNAMLYLLVADREKFLEEFDKNYNKEKE